MAHSLQARVVYPVGRPPIEHGVVTVDGERIVAVGNAADGDHVHDLGNVALLPGLVNAHTHLEFSYLKQPLGQPGMRLADWIRLVIAERGRGDLVPTDAIVAGLSESIAAGVTTMGEIATAGPTAYSCALDVLQFVEVIGFSRARVVSALSAAVERIDALHDPYVGVSPHAPYTVSPALVRQLLAMANHRTLPVAMHLAESVDELEFMSTGTGPLQELLEERSMWDGGAVPRGSRPLDYLRMLAEAPRALVIHGNYLDAAERAFLAEYAERMSLVYCPRTHAYFGHRPYPLVELLAAGVRVALGTDSRASNPDLDLLSEMRHVARAHPTIDSHDVLRMGTLAGAEALGRAADVGSLAAGKLANMVAVPLPVGARGGEAELLEEMLAGTNGASAVWVRGDLIGR